MRTDIIKLDGDLKREVWSFELSIGYSPPCIYFDYYSFQTRLTKRHRIWKGQTRWSRLQSRSNNIDKPSIPLIVESEMRAYFASQISVLPIIS